MQKLQNSILKIIKKCLKPQAKIILRFLKNLLPSDYVKFGKKHRDISIISNNCIATYLYKDLNIKYSSPTINLQFTQDGFVKFCKHFDYYIYLKIKEHPTPSSTLEDFKKLGGDNINFPVGILGDLTIFLQHYKSIEDANISWSKRSSRINRSKLFFIYMVRDQTEDAFILNFLNTAFENKLVLTNSDRREKFPQSFPLFNKELEWFEKNPLSNRPYYKQFDFLKWMNRVLSLKSLRKDRENII